MTTGRQCYPCSACCEGWITGTINGVKIGPGSPCAHCTGEGCGIYEKRPVEPCQTFKCGWLANESHFPEHMKPINCGAIVMFNQKVQDMAVISAAPIGETIPEETLEWLMAYAREQQMPLVFAKNLYENGKFVKRTAVGYGPPDFVEAVRTMILPDDITRF